MKSHNRVFLLFTAFIWYPLIMALIEGYDLFFIIVLFGITTSFTIGAIYMILASEKKFTELENYESKIRRYSKLIYRKMLSDISIITKELVNTNDERLEHWSIDIYEMWIEINTIYKDLGKDQKPERKPSECPKCHKLTIVTIPNGYNCTNPDCDFEWS